MRVPLALASRAAASTVSSCGPIGVGVGTHVDGVARAFGRGSDSRIERTENGVSAQVYRVWHGAQVFYLRVSEEENQGLAVEVEIHRRLRNLGLRVPEVVFFEAFDSGLRRSVMITTEIPGEPLSRGAALETVQQVLVAAGRELAQINHAAIRWSGSGRGPARSSAACSARARR